VLNDLQDRQIETVRVREAIYHQLALLYICCIYPPKFAPTTRHDDISHSSLMARMITMQIAQTSPALAAYHGWALHACGAGALGTGVLAPELTGMFRPLELTIGRYVA
jgi:hypothetical protein